MARVAGVDPAARGFEVGDPVHPAESEASRSVRFRGVTVSATSPNVPTRPANHDRFAALVLHSPESASPAVLLSPREAAARLGVNRETIYRLCARGELRHVRVGSALRVDLGTYLAQLRPRP